MEGRFDFVDITNTLAKDLQQIGVELIQSDGYMELLNECFALNHDFSSFASKTMIFTNREPEREREHAIRMIDSHEKMGKLLLGPRAAKQIEDLLVDVETLMRSVMCEVEDNVKLKSQVADINEHINYLDNRLLELESKQNQLVQYSDPLFPEMLAFPLNMSNTVLQNTVIKIKAHNNHNNYSNYNLLTGGDVTAGENNVVQSLGYRLPHFTCLESPQRKKRKLTVKLTIRKFAEKLKENITKW